MTTKHHHHHRISVSSLVKLFSSKEKDVNPVPKDLTEDSDKPNTEKVTSPRGSKLFSDDTKERSSGLKPFKPIPLAFSQRVDPPNFYSDNEHTETRPKLSATARTSTRQMHLFKQVKEAPNEPLIHPTINNIEFNPHKPWELQGGSLEGLLEYFLTEGPDMDFEESITPLLHGFRDYCSPMNFIETLERVTKKAPATLMKTIVNRAMQLVKLWLNRWSQTDFTDRTMLDRAVNFVMESQGLTQLDISIELLLLIGSLRRSQTRMIPLSNQTAETTLATEPPPPNGNQSPVLNTKDLLTKCWKITQSILLYSPDDITKELTLVQTKLFEKVELREFIDKAWSRGKKDLAPNLLRLIDQSNQMTYWVATMILTAPSIQVQINIAKLFIRVAKKLSAIHNFESLSQVVNGLSLSSVSRLSSLFRSIPSNYTKRLAKLKDLVSPNQAYQHYRRRLSKIDGPYFPILAVFLHDYSVTEEVTPNYRNEERKIINYEKITILYSDVSKFLARNRQYTELINTCLEINPTYIDLRLTNAKFGTVRSTSRPQTTQIPNNLFVKTPRRSLRSGSVIARTLTGSFLMRSYQTDRKSDTFPENGEKGEKGEATLQQQLQQQQDEPVIPLCEIMKCLVVLEDNDLYNRSFTYEPRKRELSATQLEPPKLTLESEGDPIDSNGKSGPFLTVSGSSSPCSLTPISHNPLSNALEVSDDSSLLLLCPLSIRATPKNLIPNENAMCTRNAATC